MAGLIIFFIIWLISHAWIENKSKGQHNEKPYPGNWIEEWLKNKSYKYSTIRYKDELHYRLDVALYTCRVNVCIILNLNDHHVVVEVVDRCRCCSGCAGGVPECRTCAAPPAAAFKVEKK